MASKRNDGLLLGPLIRPPVNSGGQPNLFHLRMSELDMEFAHQVKRLSRALYRAKRASARHRAERPY